MSKGMRVGYARVSTAGQKLDLQLERLADCDRVFHEKVSGKSTRNRPELQNALDFVRDGDVFVVTKLDRLARSVVDLANIIQKFEVKNVDLVVLDQGIDTTSIYGRLQFNILAAIGEFERGIILGAIIRGQNARSGQGSQIWSQAKTHCERNIPTDQRL
jgi:DNA invertase Pin-like site-specific DNA recombinase